MRILTTGLAAAAILLGTSALTTPAFATGGGYNPPSGGDTTNIDNTCAGVANCNGGNTYYDNDTYNKGGTGYGGKVEHSGNSYNDNDNSNRNYNSDYNNNKNEIKNSGNSYNRNSNKQGQQQQQQQYQDQDQHQSQRVEDSGNSSVNIDNERPPVNTAYSAALATSEDTCMGSSSIGGQAVSFGLTIGTTWTDDNCQRLKNSRQLVALGYHRAATALMCFNEDVKSAMEQAGTPCPSGAAAAVYVAPAAAPREYMPMAPVMDEPVRHHRRHKRVLPPK